MVAFVDDHRDECGLRPICKMLPILPSACYEQKSRRESQLQRNASHPILGGRSDLRGHMARIRLRGVRDRCLLSHDRRLARLQLATDRPSAGCLGAGAARSPRHRRLVHHSDRGGQHLSIRYTERLAEAGIEPSVGSVGDSYDNALAETVIGLHKTELIRRKGP